MRHSPFDPLNCGCHVGIADAYFIAGRYDAAVAWFEKAVLTNPKAVWINRILVAAVRG